MQASLSIASLLESKTSSYRGKISEQDKQSEGKGSESKKSESKESER